MLNFRVRAAGAMLALTSLATLSAHAALPAPMDRILRGNNLPESAVSVVVQEVGARGSMNRFVGGVMRGVAMGRDGDQVLCNVSTKSHTYTTHELMLGGECASRMQDGANEAVGRLIDKYRWSLFAVGGDTNASLTALTTDTMTWDSLVHTTYFDQPEVAAAIGDHIVRAVRESAHAGAPVPSSTATLPAMA